MSNFTVQLSLVKPPGNVQFSCTYSYNATLYRIQFVSVTNATPSGMFCLGRNCLIHLPSTIFTSLGCRLREGRPVVTIATMPNGEVTDFYPGN